MLLNHPNRLEELASALDSVHNYYERMVFQQLHEILRGRFSNNDYVADVACVALNHLPTRYIRHDVDMAFYMTASERQEMREKVQNAVQDAIKFVDNSDKRYDIA